jgi:hypothetical protein
MINVGTELKPTLKESSKKMTGPSQPVFARRGIQILNLAAGEYPLMAYASRLVDRSIACVLSHA